MPTPLTEHDYIGLSTQNPDSENDKKQATLLNFKATELRLGLPGSDDSPDGDGAEDKAVYPLGAVTSNVVSGAKRGFDEASGKWVFSQTNGSDVGLVGPGQAQDQQTGLGLGSGSGSGGVNDGVSPAVKAGMDKKKTHGISPAAKAQVVGWPPIRSFRKNMMDNNPQKNDENVEGKSGADCLYVKVSMDGAPYLRKVDLKTYGGYMDLSSALEKMFSCFTIGQCGSHGVQGRDGLNESRLVDLLHGSEYVLTYEDKDGDWMLVGDVPWEMFTDSCKRLRIMKSSEAVGLAPRAMDKCKNRN